MSKGAHQHCRSAAIGSARCVRKFWGADAFRVLYIIYCIFYTIYIKYIYIFIGICIHHAQVAAEARKFVKDAALEEMISVIEGDSREAML